MIFFFLNIGGLIIFVVFLGGGSHFLIFLSQVFSVLIKFEKKFFWKNVGLIFFPFE